MPQRQATTVRKRNKRIVSAPRRSTRGAPVNTPATVTNTSNGIYKTGTDQIQVVTIPAGTPSGTVVFAQSFNVGLTQTLRNVGRSFSNWKLKHAVWDVVSKTNTMVGGGYVMATSPDPMYAVPGGPEAIAQVLALEGATSVKAWQSKAIRAKSLSQLKYTIVGNDPRLYEDHVFVLLVDSPPTEEISLSVTLKWGVHFSHPAIYADATGNVHPYTVMWPIVANNISAYPINDGDAELPWSEGLAGFPELHTVPANSYFIFQLPAPVINTVGNTRVLHRYFKLVRTGEGYHSFTSYAGQPTSTWHQISEDSVFESVAAPGDIWRLLSTNILGFRVHTRLDCVRQPSMFSQRLTLEESIRSSKHRIEMLKLSDTT
ncbi:hypothetical protein 3 [Hubei tombus-like virus 21]|uniref:hypothetical protein 3 n=1 Tax=Hubei tombus-like virus 21 TaxID=1923268 RepID=UPI0009098C4C|nr:hypothetical protein 3 [Hubei tombus-like virus 21]APG76386.1 hypothetical protein 3 [Hubei tombus-like virus 21]